MSEDGFTNRKRHISISSERTLDNLETLPSAVTSPVLSPSQNYSAELMDNRPGYAHPPHHHQQHSDDSEDETARRSRVPWKDQSTTQLTSDSHGNSRVIPSGERRTSADLTPVRTGSDSSPIRRLKRKDANLEPTEESPGGDSWSPKPLKPSKLSSHADRPPHRKHRDKSSDMEVTAESYQMERVSKRKSKKKRKHKEDNVNGAHVNKGFTESEQNEASKKSASKTGGLQPGGIAAQLRSSLTSLTLPFNSKSKSQKVVTSMCQDNRKTRDQMDEEYLAKFVKNSGICQRKCAVYLRDVNAKVEKCYCGRTRVWHQENGASMRPAQLLGHEPPGHKEIWHHKTHSKTEPTDSFGVVQFQGFGQDTQTSPYIRLCPETDMETVWDLVTKHWQLPIPKLLISVTGGAQRFEMNSRLKAMFKRGLINAATTTGAWIITGGTATGVMQFVGEAVRDHLITSATRDVVALGIATWGCVANRDALDGDGDTGLFPATYSMEDLADITSSDVPLDSNHTHFILVDNGTEGKFGREIEFRAMFEKYVSEKVETGVAESQSVNVPTVMLVVEGGINTLKTVCQAIDQNIPVLVLDGSGRAADLIAYGYMLSKDPKKNEDKSYFDQDFDEELMRAARTTFVWKATDKVEQRVHECLRQVRDILRVRRLINIFNLTETNTKDIDRAILYALLKANKTNANAQLALALAWNRSDIARDEIFTSENRLYSKNVNLYDAMFTALVQDRVDFVQLFLENGVSTKKFLSIDTLWNLYANTLSEKSESMSQLLTNLLVYLRQSWAAYLLCQPTNMSGFEPDLLNMVGKVMVNLIGDEKMNPYKDEKFIVRQRRPHLKWLPGNHESGGVTMRSLITRPSADNARKFFKRRRQEYDFNKSPERELFYWAILLNRRDLARMFWRAGQDQIGAAVVASALLKALASIADADEELELSQDLMEHANLYEDMAYGVLSECYKKDKKMARQLLVRKLEQYGSMTLFSLADSHSLMNFMGHTCCQTKLNLIWKGNMAQYTQNWKIAMCFLLPVLIPAQVIKFTSNDSILDESEDEFDDLDDEDPEETTKEEVHVISNKESNNKPSNSLSQPSNSLQTVGRWFSSLPSKISFGKNEDGKVMPSAEGDGKVEEEYFVRSKTRRKKRSKKKLYNVHIFNDRKTNRIGLFNAIYFFYTAPVTVFGVNVIAYLAYLGLFTYFVLTDLYEKHPSVYEYVIWFWTLTMLVEEFRQVFATDKMSLWYKLRNWISSMWNRFDLTMYILFILSVIFRLNFTGDNFVYARVLYSVTLAMYYLRFMQMFFVEKNIGPKVVMIRNMLIDLAFFLGIFLVFMLSFGVVYQANLFPNSEPSLHLLKSVIYIPYWQMYGELFLENMDGDPPDGCTRNETIWRASGGENRCPERNTLVPILAAIYLVLTNILLVNLLIAMFSYTFQTVQDQSEKVWRFFRYSLVYEFYDRPMLCPPLSILVHILRFSRYISRRTCSTAKYTNEFRLNLDDKDNNRLTVFVQSSTDNYLNITQKMASEEIGNRVADTATRIEKVIEELDHIKETVIHPRHNEDKDLMLTGDPLERNDTPTMLTARKLTSRPSNLDLMETQLRDLTHQVSQNSIQMTQMMDILQQLTSQRSRPSQLEITQMSPHSDT